MQLSTDNFPKVVQPLFQIFHVDFQPPRQPSKGEVLLASLVAIVGSLVADWALVQLGTRVFPATKGYQHFQFSDYSKLTVIGVVIACIGWPVVTRISSTPRWLYCRMAIAVTVVLFAPDVFIWINGQPTDAVFVLMVMHLAIAVVTYYSLVVLAPTRRLRGQRPLAS
jgi:H+/Cl- antiporter ClcA